MNTVVSNIEQKKIYFLINSLEGGGAEKVVRNLSAVYIAQGMDVFVITLKKVAFYELQKGIIQIALSNVKNNFLMFILIPRYAYKFKKLLVKYGLTEGISFLEIANFVHILAKKNATISFRTNIVFFKGIVGNLYKFLIKLLYPSANKIVVNSEENKFDIADYLDISENKVEVMYNSIDMLEIESNKNEPLDKKLNARLSDKIVLITTGRLIKSKHHEKIVDALFAIYQSGFTNRIYLIVGDGPQRKSLEKLVKKYNLIDNTVFLGSQKNVFKYLEAADYFIYASEAEGFPNVLAEAKAINLPIITSDFKSGAKEVILGKYDRYLQISYPYNGPYGIILDPEKFEVQLKEWYITI